MKKEQQKGKQKKRRKTVIPPLMVKKLPITVTAIHQVLLGGFALLVLSSVTVIGQIGRKIRNN